MEFLCIEHWLFEIRDFVWHFNLSVSHVVGLYSYVNAILNDNDGYNAHVRNWNASTFLFSHFIFDFFFASFVCCWFFLFRIPPAKYWFHKIKSKILKRIDKCEINCTKCHEVLWKNTYYTVIQISFLLFIFKSFTFIRILSLCTIILLLIVVFVHFLLCRCLFCF